MTLAALVLLDIAVRLHVGAQVGAIGERPRAHITLERLLARVRSHMALQQPRPAEALATDFALAGQGVRANVHLERAQRRVRLLAVLAREALGDLSTAVELLVLGQAAKCRVALAASIALIASQVGHVVAAAAAVATVRAIGLIWLAGIDQAIVVDSVEQ